ncbi:hypothetical protein ACQ4PT_052350 [Festuca glaucescens]
MALLLLGDCSLSLRPFETRCEACSLPLHLYFLVSWQHFVHCFRRLLSSVDLFLQVPPLWDSLGLTSAETFAEFCSLLLSRMCAVVSVLVSILECLAARCALPALLYLREVMEDGSVLAGVELELPDDGLCVGPRRKFFWGDVWRGSFDAYDQPAIQAISFLQGMYGFVIRDYNYDSAPFTSPLEPSWVGFTLEEAEILKGKSFYGAPDYKCGSCKASFWYQERVKSASAVTERRVVYNNCCKAGKVFVQPFEKPPAFLQELLHFDGPQRSKGFIEKIRQYNCLFAFTSMGATIDRSVNNGGGPNIYKISGNVCHRIGSLLPEEGQAPKFAELYIYHGGDEVDNRIQALNKDDRIEGALDKTIVKGLERMLDAHNPLVKKFRMAKQVLEENEFTDICIRIVGPGESDGPQFNLPSTDELACLVVVEPGQRPHNRADIAVRVYHMKLNEYLGLIKSGKAFGKVTAVLHTVEFQKRGLPHAHILVWRDKGERGEVTPALIDSHVCAEIPDPVQDPLGTYNSVVYESFKDACAATGLLGDDNEWHYAFDEALKWGMGRQLRQLFVTMILFCGVLDENAFFEKYWTYLAEDIQHRIRSSLHDSAYLVPVDELRNMLIEELSGVFARSGCSILDHNLPLKSVCDPTSHVNNMINDELCQDFDSLIKTAEAMQEKLNENQRAAFESIVDRVRKEKPAFFFVSGHGGTGKTFLWNALVAYLRGYQRIVLTVASSGVASLLLPGGRTAHSRFKIPIDLDDNGVCDIRRCTMLSSLIESASLIIWDEALMTHRKCFEALDRTLRDVLSEHDPSLADEPFGGKIVVLGGDLRQILPVIEGGTRSQVVNAAITNSPLWSGVQVLPLTINMRLAVKTMDPNVQAEATAFAKWVLSVGDGTVPAVSRQGESDPTWITIPDEHLLHTDGDKIAAIVDSVYVGFLSRYSDPAYLTERAILTPTNELAETVNTHVLSMLPGEEREYLSCDSTGKTADGIRNIDIFYPVEILNTIKVNNFPYHRLVLKKGVPIMLLRNISQTTGLCNGTRLVVTRLADKAFEFLVVASMEFSLLSEIHKDSNQWTIRVLVSRMWNYRGGTDEGPIIHGDVVLLDKEGNHMYGQLPPATADRLRDVLKEGKVYVIRKFLCNASKPSFRPVESPFMVQFTKFTIAEEQPGLEDDYPFCTYNLCAYTDIPEVGGPPTRFIDVIGRISQVSDLIPVQSSYQATVSNTRTIVLTNLRGDKMRIVLWGDRAIEFDADAVRAMGEREPVIAIFVGTLPKTHRGIKGLSGSSACRWYIDEDIPDINEFRSCLGDQFIPVAPYVSTQPGALPPRVYETPVEMSMAQLSKVDPFTDMEKRFLVTVTIERLGSDQRWFFSSCKSCRKSARFDGYQYQCSGENCGCVAADQTYCLSVFAGDATDEAEFVFFDRVATGVVRKQLYTLLRQRYPGHSSLDAAAQAARHDARIPSEITRLVGQKFKLLVCISKKWQTQTITEDLSFQVCKVQETYKPELPALSFAGASGSGGASSSTSGAGMLPVQHTPSTLGSPHSQASRAGYGSPIGQSASPPPNLAPATPTPVTTPKGPSAPRRGAKRSLLSSLGSPAKAKAQLAADNGSGTEDEATIIEPPAQAMVDGAMTVEDKGDAPTVPKSKRNTGKKVKQQ